MEHGLAPMEFIEEIQPQRAWERPVRVDRLKFAPKSRLLMHCGKILPLRDVSRIRLRRSSAPERMMHASTLRPLGSINFAHVKHKPARGNRIWARQFV
jgi:hypothetical protein